MASSAILFDSSPLVLPSPSPLIPPLPPRPSWTTTTHDLKVAVEEIVKQYHGKVKFKQVKEELIKRGIIRKRYAINKLIRRLKEKYDTKKKPSKPIQSTENLPTEEIKTMNTYVEKFWREVGDDFWKQDGGISNVDQSRLVNSKEDKKKESSKKAVSAKKPDDEALTCVICMDLARTHVFVPCGHMSCCGKCAGKVTECPMCRAKVSSIVRLFV